MSGLKKFKRSIIIRCVVVPIIITLIALFALNTFLPAFESRLPDAGAYSSQTEEALSDE